MATCSVSPCVLILDILDVGVILLISGYNTATKIYIRAFLGHTVRFYSILFLLTVVLFDLLPKKKVPQST